MDRKQEQFFDALYDQWFSKLCAYANVRVKNLPIAEEVVQDTFLVALLKIDVLMNTEHPERWLKKTVQHKLLHYFRDRSRKLDRIIPLDDIDQKSVSVFDTEIEKIESSEEERLQRIQEILETTLKEEEKVLLQKIAFEEKSYEKAAEELGISLWTCQKRMQRLRGKLRKTIRNKGVDAT